MARLGPSFIKAAQVLAMREDIIRPEYTFELKKLQDRVPPFPYQDVKETISRVYGQEIEELFDDFQKEPIAAASLGQVHKASYKGQKVAVKVLRPGVQELVENDIRTVKVLLYIAAIFLDENIMRSAYAIISEFQRMIHLEMDFRSEMKNADRLRHNFRNDERIYVPDFVENLTRKQIVVIDFVDGVRVDRPEEIRRLGVDPAVIVDLIIESYVRMTVIHGFIHADPHPGNLMVDHQGRLVVLDFGMALEFEERTRLELLKMVYAVTKGDIDTIVDGYYTLGMVDADINRGDLREAASTMINIQLNNDLTPRQVQEIAQDIIDTFYKFPLLLPNNLVYLLRAASLVEGIALQYNPRFNAVREATPIVKKMLAEVAFPGSKDFKERVKEGAQEVYMTLRELGFIIHRLEREQLRIRIHEADIRRFEGFAGSVLRRVLFSIGVITACIVLVIAMMMTTRYILFGVPIFILICLFLLVTILPLPRGSGRNGSPYLR